MGYERIKKFLLTVFNEDYVQNNKEYSYVSQMIVITIKSLIPSRNIVGTKVDYERYEKELRLWYFYRNGENASLLNSFSSLDDEIYWDNKDDTLYERISPIVLANNDWGIIKEEIIKNILYTTGNISSLLEGILLSKILHLLLIDNKNDTIQNLKDEIINFSQKDFIKKFYGNFRISPKRYSGNYNIDFERNRLDIINVLNGMETNRFPILEDILLKKYGEISIFTKGIQSLIKDTQYEYKDYFYEDMCQYLYKLKKGRIPPELLEIKNYCLPDIFKFDIGDVFSHSLLNKSKIIKKEESKEEIIVYVASKSGIHRFFKNKRPSN